MIVPDLPLLWTVWISSAVLWLGVTVLIVRRWKLPQPPAAWVIVGLALVVRLGYALLVPPALSDDIWRYLHDGRTLADGHNPYATAPLEAWEQARADGLEQAEAVEWMTWINNSELVTIYQPTSQLAFAGITVVGDVMLGEERGALADARLYRVVFSLVDALIVVLLIAELRRRGRSVWWATLYAWSPLVLCETAWSGHQDGLGIAAMVGALVVAPRGDDVNSMRWWRSVTAGLLLGVAAGVKPIVIPLALPLVWQLKASPRGWTHIGLAAGSCVVVLIGLYLPFVLMEGGLSGMLETSREFVSRWRFNGSLHPLIEWGTRSVLTEGEPWDVAARAKTVADAITGGLVLMVLLVATVCWREPWRVAGAFMFALVCVSSTAHPWYLLWAMAVLPVAWSAGRSVVGPAIWVASLTLPWSYIAWVNYANGGTFDGEYQPGLGATLAVWIPVYVALMFGLLRNWGLLQRRS